MWWRALLTKRREEGVAHLVVLDENNVSREDLDCLLNLLELALQLVLAPAHARGLDG